MQRNWSVAEKQSRSEVLLGTHVSTAGGFCKALDRAESIGCTAMQVFVKGNTRWAFPAPKTEDVAKYRERISKSGVQSVIAHSIYLVNLCSNNPEFLRKSIEDMVDEIQRCELLGIEGLVMHPGAHCGAGVEFGIEQVAKALDTIFEQTPDAKCRVLLETTAGQGSSVGGQFEHVAEIMKQVRNQKRLGVCLDTCHVFAAGYEIRNPESYGAMWKQFDKVIGMKKLRAIHLNDSKKGLGSKLDRHEHIGKGELGLEPFRFIMNDPALRGIPMVLETDKDPDMKQDVENLEVLKSLLE
jgi:deoxyribonuclease-4